MFESPGLLSALLVFGGAADGVSASFKYFSARFSQSTLNIITKITMSSTTAITVPMRKDIPSPSIPKMSLMICKDNLPAYAIIKLERNLPRKAGMNAATTL